MTPHAIVERIEAIERIPLLSTARLDVVEGERELKHALALLRLDIERDLLREGQL